MTRDTNLGEHALERDLDAAKARQRDRLTRAHSLGKHGREPHDVGIRGGIGERVVMLLERRPVHADALRQDLLDECAEQRVPPA